MPDEQQWRTRLSLPVSYGVARTLWLRRGVSPRRLRAKRRAAPMPPRSSVPQPSPSITCSNVSDRPCHSLGHGSS